MVEERREQYDLLKRSSYILVNYYVILQFCPNYKDIISKLEQEEFVSKEDYLLNNNNEEYEFYKHKYEKIKRKVISLCRLVEYIGTYQGLTEEEKNKELEELLSKYNISIMYYNFDDLDDMQIKAGDIALVIDELEQNLQLLESIRELVVIKSIDDDILEKQKKQKG